MDRAPGARARPPAPPTGVMGPDLVRILGRLLEVPSPAAGSRTAFADTLAGWTTWTDAIALSAALDRPDAAGLAAAASGPVGGEAASFRRVLRDRLGTAEPLAADPERPADPHDQARALCDEVRARLVAAMDAEIERTGRSPIELEQGFTPFRHCMGAQQHAMMTALIPLRERLRIELGQMGPDPLRLAALDAAMTPVLAAQERRLLGRIPAMLERRYLRLRNEATAAQTADGTQAAQEAGGPASAAWLDPFRGELRAILHAELALRLQPIEGLIAALRVSSPRVQS